MTLTDKACKNAQPQEKPYKKADGAGLYLQVMPNGSKYWRLKYRYLGKEKVLALGVYDQMSLLEAREARDRAQKLVKAGQDPSQQKRLEKLQRAQDAENSFEAVAREWHAKRLPMWSKNYGVEVLHRMVTDVFPHIGFRPIGQITPPELLQVIKKIEKRGALEAARRTLQLCGQVFKYAIPNGLAERNPAADLTGALTPRKRTHFAALDSKELPAFIKALEGNEARLYVSTRRAVKLLMLTFVRTSELIGASWDEFDFENKQWNIPAERMKMRQPHIVPLSNQVIALLEEQKELTGRWKWVFPNLVRPMKCMSNNTILKALERMGYKGRMTGHGFRALAMSTIKENLGYRHEVVDRQLAHAQRNSVDAAYDRAKFLQDRHKMMQEWANYLDSIAAEGRVVWARFGGAK